MGDHRLALALDQEPDELPLPCIEPGYGLVQEAFLQVLSFLGIRGDRRHAAPFGKFCSRRIVECGEAGCLSRLPSPAAGNIERPVVGEPLQVGTAVVGSGAAARIEPSHGRLSSRRSRQASQMVEDERHRIVECRRITNAPLKEHAANDRGHDRLRRSDHLLERGVVSRRLPLAEQRLESDAGLSRHAPVRQAGSFIHEHASYDDGEASISFIEYLGPTC
jgi:hypothetical protein